MNVAPYVDFPPAALELMQRQLSQFGRVGATRIYRTPVIAGILAGQDSPPVSIQFRERGIVLALYGQVESGAVADFAGTEVRIQIAGQEDLITDGQSGQFAPMLSLFGQTQNWFPVLRSAVPELIWQVTFRNRTAGTVVPQVELAFIGEGDLRKAR